MQSSKQSYQSTIYACYIGFIIQAAVVNLTPILFIPLRELFGLSYEQLGALILINFVTQVITDLVFSSPVDKYGFRPFIITAQALAVAGFVLFAAAPLLFANPYAGFVLGTVVFSIGGGLLELQLSPIVNAIPTPEKASAMSMLHSFYAWGQVGVVILTTLYVFAFGRTAWQGVVLLWAIVPLINFFIFMRVPLAPSIPEESRQGMRFLIRQPFFYVALLAIAFGAASELNMAQWTSAFMERALNLPKLLGDVAGVSAFGLMLGLGRLIHGKFGDRYNINRIMMAGALAAAACYLIVGLSPWPWLSLVACAFTGFAVSLLWPGTLVIAAARYPLAGAWMFAILAASGDIGGSLGPWLVGVVTDQAPQLSAVAGLAASLNLTHEQMGLRIGMLLGVVIPFVCYLCHLWMSKHMQPVTKPAQTPG